MYGATQSFFLVCNFLPQKIELKINSLLTVIYVVYVNPRCENKGNSYEKIRKKGIGRKNKKLMD